MSDDVEKVQGLVLLRRGCAVAVLIQPSRDELLECLAKDRLDVLHFSAEGAPHGIHLRGEEFLESSVLAVAVVKSGAWLAIFNFCHSIFLAQQAFDLGLRTAIGWAGKLSDQVARAWEQTFFSALLVLPDLELAFRQSCLMMDRFFPYEEKPLLLKRERKRRPWPFLVLAAAALAALAAFIFCGGVR